MNRSMVLRILFLSSIGWVIETPALCAQDKLDTLEHIDVADQVILQDGLPLRIRAIDGYSSATAKVGQPILFTLTYPVLIDGIIVIPAGCVVTAKVLTILPPRGRLRDGNVSLAFDGITLPSGEVLSVRPVLSPPSKNRAKDAINSVAGAPGTALQYSPPFLPLLFIKGEDQLVKPGTTQVVYLNGQARLSRASLNQWEASSSPSTADVYYVNRYGGIHLRLYCGHFFLGDFSYRQGVHLKLKQGTYWFSTGNTQDAYVEVQALPNNPSYIEREKGGLFLKDFQSNVDLIYHSLLNTSSDLDLTVLPNNEVNMLSDQPIHTKKP